MKQTGFILKVLPYINWAVDFDWQWRPILSIPATPTNALTVVLMPTLIVAIALWRRTSQQRQRM